MSNRKFTKFLFAFNLLLIAIIVMVFLYRFTILISENTYIFFWLGSDGFATFSFFDGVIKISLVFVAIVSVVLCLMKFTSIKLKKRLMILISIFLVILFLASNIIHLGSYDLKYYTIYKMPGLSEYGISEMESKYENYLPFIDRFKEVTVEESRYSCTESTTPLGYYLYMEENCDELDVSFYYEELQTSSKLALLQFLITKGTPELENEYGETIQIEAVENSEFNCKVYSYGDFYEIWFVESNNITIIKYEKIGELFEMSKDDILNHAKNMYDSLHGKFSENRRFVNWEYATFDN